MSDLDRSLTLLRALHDKKRAEQQASGPRQEPLPFDGEGSYLADARPEFHGSSVGVSRHADAGEPLCGPCFAWMRELAASGYARPAGIAEHE